MGSSVGFPWNDVKIWQYWTGFLARQCGVLSQHLWHDMVPLLSLCRHMRMHLDGSFDIGLAAGSPSSSIRVLSALQGRFCSLTVRCLQLLLDGSLAAVPTVTPNPVSISIFFVVLEMQPSSSCTPGQ